MAQSAARASDPDLAHCLDAFRSVGVVVPPAAAWNQVALQMYDRHHELRWTDRQSRASWLPFRGHRAPRHAATTFFALWYPDRFGAPYRAIQLLQARSAAPTDVRASGREAASLARLMHPDFLIPIDRDPPWSLDDINLLVAGRRVRGQLATMTSPAIQQLAFALGSVYVRLSTLGDVEATRVAEQLVPLDAAQADKVLSAAALRAG